VKLPEPETRERVTIAFLLRPEQAAWLRNHAGRRGMSSLMRQILQQLMDDERREIERVRRRLAKAASQATAREAA
jgi:HPt (histidine-containing phosphotransfer) domain-containing protein